MKKAVALIGFLAVFSCQQKDVVYTPVGEYKEESQVEISKNRARKLNQIERLQIEDWIKHQKVQFYAMPLNYWINVAELHKNTPKQKGERVSFEYDVYDFANNKVYSQPKTMLDVQIGRFNELKAIEDAVTYLAPGQSATLLVPSVLGYGTYGDGDKIGSDIPLIIHVKVL